jgi:hypothetical protein
MEYRQIGADHQHYIVDENYSTVFSAYYSSYFGETIKTRISFNDEHWPGEEMVLDVLEKSRHVINQFVTDAALTKAISTELHSISLSLSHLSESIKKVQFHMKDVAS